MAERATKISPGIIVQGGAYSSRVNVGREEFMRGIKQAARRGYAVLMQEGKTVIDAVEEAVRVMEDDGYFNAGRGSFLNDKGAVECDAMIMDGRTMNLGAVMAVRHFTNPVSLSRKVMEETPHCALCADGALKFAQEINFPICDPQVLEESTSLKAIIGNENYRSFVKHHYAGMGFPSTSDHVGDTVTAVVIDANGHLACAASTGGIPGKKEGRIGDAPMVGCGGYANEFGAATLSGNGEALMKMTVARDVVFNIENGLNAQEATEKSLQRMQDREHVKGYGGIVAIDKDGNFGKAFNTEVMIWASVRGDMLNYGMDPGECRTERVDSQ